MGGAHCRKCGDELRQTNVSQVTRVRIRAGFPWYRSDVKPPRGQTRRRYELCSAVILRAQRRWRCVWTSGSPAHSPGYWFTFDAGPGNDTAQEGRRLVRQWAPTDVAAPAWLAELKKGDA